MYTDEKKKSNLLVNFILKLILIIIFVLLLVWLVPWPNMDSLNPLKDQIFNANLQTMKEAGILYFTSERLPEEVGDKTTLTLQQMLDLKLLIPFTDRNGDSCDVTASYVSLEKYENEYLMKVNLKCGEEEDYILVHLGCYSYCITNICEAKPGSTEKPTTKPVATKTPTPTVTPTPTPKPIPKPTPTTKPTPTPTPTPEPIVEKEYQYKKTTEDVYSEWTDWTTYRTSADTVIKEVDTDTKKVEDLGVKKVQIGIKEAVYETIYETKAVMEIKDYYKYKVCTNYSYTADVDTVYRIDSDWAYVDKWYSGYNPPADTISSRWILQGVDFDQCGDDCTNHPYLIYRQQTRKVTEYKVYSDITATCNNVEERSIPIYGTRIKTTEKTVLKEEEQPIYEDYRFYRVKTRTLLSEGTTTYKWSFYNDQTLLKQGYVMTGKTRNKK